MQIFYAMDWGEKNHSLRAKIHYMYQNIHVVAKKKVTIVEVFDLWDIVWILIMDMFDLWDIFWILIMDIFDLWDIFLNPLNELYNSP